MTDQIHLPAVGNRVRLALLHAVGWRPILWVRVGTDGSIYTGLLVGSPSTGLTISKPAEHGKVTILHTEGTKFEGSAVPSSSRVSFKASGEIHLGREVLAGRPLEGLTKPRQLCLMRFAHPSRYRPLSKKNANDYDIGIAGYPLDEARPMYGALFVSPWPSDGKISRIALRNMKFKADVFLAFRGLGRTPDVALQIAFGHGPEGPWPDLPGIAVLARG